jgi:hypothetical protein
MTAHMPPVAPNGPRRQRLTELERDHSSAGAHDHARDPLRMCRRRGESCRCSHVRPDDVRPAQISLGLAAGEPCYDDLEQRLAGVPVIAVPTITLEGDANFAPHPEPADYAAKSQASRPTAPSRVASGTTCHRKPRTPSSRQSSTSTASPPEPAHAGADGICG